MDIKFDDLLSFVATVRHQSISRAADSLGLTQPAVTRRVQNLEEALRLTLLDRVTKPPKPTAIGLQVYQQCVKVLQEVDSLRSLSAQEHISSGPFRLGLTQALADTGLAELLPRLSEHFPALQPQVGTRWSGELLKQVLSGELDLAVAMLPLQHGFPPGVEATLLGLLQIVIVAAKGRFRAKTLHLAEIHQAGWVLNPLGCGFRKYLQAQLEERGLALQIVTEAFGTDLQLRTVAGGAGLGLLPLALLQHSPYASELEVLNVKDFSLKRGLWLLNQTRTKLPPDSLKLVADTFSELVSDR